MARVIKGWQYGQHLDLAQLDGDRQLTPRIMKAYLQYRLYLLEVQIRYLSQRLGANEEAEYRARWAWARRPEQDEAYDSWASLNYLMAARDKLRRALDTLPRGQS